MAPLSSNWGACRHLAAGVAIRAEHPGCIGGNCIFQGNQVVGNLIEGGVSQGDSSAIFMNSLANPCPAWDSNNVSKDWRE
jgi:hypothetical protein